jgi:hypothetical protein
MRATIGRVGGEGWGPPGKLIGYEFRIDTLKRP